MKKLSLFGDRVAVSIVNEVWPGKLLLPESRTKMFVMGRVTAVSHLRLPSKEAPAAVAEPGDLVIFQTNLSSANFTLNGAKAMVLHPGDVLGRLSTPTSAFSGFTPLGSWVLVTGSTPSVGQLVLPDPSLQQAEKFVVEQQGPWVAQDLGEIVGEEVVLERSRVNPIEIDGRTLGYVDKVFVHGVVRA